MNKIKNNKIIKFNVLFLLLAIIALALFNFASYANVRAESCDTLIGDDKDKCIIALEKKAEAYQDIIDIKVKQQTALQKQMTLIDAEQSKNQSALQEVHEKFQTTLDQINNLKRRIEHEETQIEQQKIILSGLMQSYYEDDQQGVLDIVLANRDFSEILNQSDYIQQSSFKVSDVLKSIQDIKNDLDRQKIALEETKTEHENLQNQLEDKNLNLQNTEAQKQKLFGQTKADAEKYQNLLDNIENEIYSLESSKSVDYSNVPAAKGGYFDYPVSSEVITQSYGCLKDSFAKRSYPTCDNGSGGFHNGLDFGKNSGNSIFSVKSGRVIASGDNGKYAYGRWLAIDHADGLVTLYGHLSSKLVAKGAKVEAGQKIGIIGTTGYSTGIHLHFSVFDKNSFEIVESLKVNGLMLPAGASISPKRYLK
jgi:murein DD-endopeptidase MepM/ murein hydrolase activator NlpD